MFKKIMTDQTNYPKYYIITFITILMLSVIVFVAYSKSKQVLPIEEEIVQFNFSIDGKQYIIPSAFHSFEFLNDMGFPWKKLTVSENNSDYPNESQLALNLGMRAADGIVSLYADEKEDARFTRSTVLELTNKLGITPDIKNTVSALDQAVILHAEQKALGDRLMDLEFQIEKNLHKQKKDNLAVLVELGWLEGLYIVSKGISQNYNPAYAEILRQPHIAEIYIEVLTSLSKRTSDEKEKVLLESILKHIIEISKIANHTHKESFPLSKVKELYQISSNVKKLIESK